jgi:hypothetical protein
VTAAAQEHHGQKAAHRGQGEVDQQIGKGCHSDEHNSIAYYQHTAATGNHTNREKGSVEVARRRPTVPKRGAHREKTSLTSLSRGSQGRMGGSQLNRDARINILKIIMTLAMLLSNAKHASGFQAYSCDAGCRPWGGLPLGASKS